jgi:hypothetical protein
MVCSASQYFQHRTEQQDPKAHHLSGSFRVLEKHSESLSRLRYIPWSFAILQPISFFVSPSLPPLIYISGSCPDIFFLSFVDRWNTRNPYQKQRLEMDLSSSVSHNMTLEDARRGWICLVDDDTLLEKWM